MPLRVHHVAYGYYWKIKSIGLAGSGVYRGRSCCPGLRECRIPEENADTATTGTGVITVAGDLNSIPEQTSWEPQGLIISLCGFLFIFRSAMINYLVIEGNIGAGKTSLASMIAEKHNARLILEQYADNPFLPKFYRDPNRYSFPLELSFLAARYNQLHKELTSPDLFQPLTVADYFFSKSLIFAKITLQIDEFNLYRQLFDIIHQQLPKPDLYVYLYVSIEKLVSNIRKRGRDYEQDIKPDYLERVQQGYFEYLRSLQDQKIIVLDMEHLDFIYVKRHYSLIEDAIFHQKHVVGMNRIQLP